MNLTIATGADPRIMPDERPQVIGGTGSGNQRGGHQRGYQQQNQHAQPAGYGQMSVRHQIPSNQPSQHGGQQSQNRPKWQPPPQNEPSQRPQFYPPPPNHAPPAQHRQPSQQPIHSQQSSGQRPDVV